MAVNKIIIEAHSNPEGLYQFRFQIRGWQKGVNDELLDLDLATALKTAHNVVDGYLKQKGIKVKKKNIVVNRADVERLAERDPYSKDWLEGKLQIN